MVTMTKAAMMKMPDTTADTTVIAGDTPVCPLMISPTSFARLPMYTYARMPAHMKNPYLGHRLQAVQSRGARAVPTIFASDQRVDV